MRITQMPKTFEFEVFCDVETLNKIIIYIFRSNG